MEKPQKLKIQQTSNGNKFTSLPIELHHDIFSRLPSKPLHICKSVSKQWYTIITSPDFTRFHILHSLSSPHSNRLLVFEAFTHLCSSEFDTGITLPAAISKHTNTVTSPQSPDRTPSWLKLVGSSNGLVCFSETTYVRSNGLSQERLFVYNPFTRGPKREIPMQVEVARDKGFRFYGFGYDSATDDYKIMLVHEKIGHPRVQARPWYPIQREAKVFSLRSGLWNPVNDFCYREINGESFKHGKFLNGNLHWGVRLADDIDSDEDHYYYDHAEGDYFNYRDTLLPNIGIVRFDCEKYTYTLMVLPTELSKGVRDEEGYVDVGIYEGSLSLQVMNYGDKGKHQFDAWVMKEYGVSKSWVRLFSFEVGYSVEVDVDFSHFVRVEVVAYCTETHRILVSRNSSYYWYDAEGNELGDAGYVESRNGRSFNFSACIVCAGSLISPFCGNEDCRFGC